MKKIYDLAIIGSGPGGYAASIRASELGLSACIIEKELIGGACLNWGCIPTKSIARSADLLSEIRQSSNLGIDIKSYSLDIEAILKRKEEIVSRLRNAAESLLKMKGIDIYRSKAELISPNEIQITDDTIQSRHIIIATGSMPIETRDLKIDKSFVLSSRDMLDLKTIPERLVIIGGGFIGCEFASIYNRLGTNVTIIELMDQLLPGFDKEVARRLELVFKKHGINVLKNTKVLSVEKDPESLVRLSDGSTIKANKVFLCIGRRPDIEGLNLAGIGINVEKGAIVVDENLKTNIPNIYCIGDANGKYFLAHVASYQGTLVCDNIAGAGRRPDYSAVPSAIFTHPEIATVGVSSDEAKQKNIDIELLKLPFSAVSKAHIIGETEGFVKLVVDAKTKKIIGASIFGILASELISNFTIAVKYGLTVSDISDTIFAHPTLSESFLSTAQKDTSSYKIPDNQAPLR
jgi:dihydrolipoamide dehydrogenase